MGKKKHKKMDFYKAWNYLENHTIFQDKYGKCMLMNCLDVAVVKVDPKTNSVSDDFEKNTSTRVWLEAGPYREAHATHDIALDCGAKNFEKAIIKLAKKVRKEYSDYDDIALERVHRLYDDYDESLKFQNRNFDYDDDDFDDEYPSDYPMQKSYAFEEDEESEEVVEKIMKDIEDEIEEEGTNEVEVEYSEEDTSA